MLQSKTGLIVLVVLIVVWQCIEMYTIFTQNNLDLNHVQANINED
jgi:hypothetical protein